MYFGYVFNFHNEQRHYFANRGPFSQSHGFSSSHIWMWELDHKEGWAPKNWYFWTVVLEKILESESRRRRGQQRTNGWISSPTQWMWVWASFRRRRTKDVWLLMLCLTLCHSTDYSTPGFPVLHHIPEFSQTQVRWPGIPNSFRIFHCLLWSTQSKDLA